MRKQHSANRAIFVLESPWQLDAGDANLRWCAGYSTKINWLDGTLLDSAILAQMLYLDDEDFEEAKLIVDAFAEAIAPFSKRYAIGTRNGKKRLDESLEVVVQAKGQGKRAKSMTSEVFQKWEEKQSRNGAQ